MRLITLEDFKDIYIKFHQRGLTFLLSKLSFNSYLRTKTAFNDFHIEASNFWIIPAVRERWNILITGNAEKTYEEFITENYFQDKKQLRVLSLGSGVCSHEIRLAALNPHWEIDCFDFSDELLANAKNISDGKKLTNIHYFAENIMEFKFEKNSYDIVFFHASLHHFDDIPNFFTNIINTALNKTGYLIINEFVGKNRLQYSKIQIDYINKALKLIPKKYRKILKTTLYKNKYYSSGILRMIIADPSECIDSESILPIVNKNYETILEKKYGNNLLQSVFKDIAHHFVPENNETLSLEKQEILNKIFKLEDEFLTNNPSDYVFGIYRLK
ncbi:class I SAM-dependent methyltransferase [Frigoriflavimonas asaccharolytica]|uniref:Ubiquinone/menaquinone biosynthesis C-methylase UbiE n=1 Tax=Frigoriflavimonas asaccharolytica TaxID=2735899 RepID=A0A8J8K6W8_9FLAO|nr:class I SAM-dependent methyltransferase [Frigoriflavimonas asaccharolytica]NRS91398.1 ubiquinone/menaquinone biosynthesis C-methylase UbiE [Frigoriflavimonas asaccharolytica]